MTPPHTWSVVLPTHNRAHLLPEAIQSVCAQTVGDWELIVIDDGSDDDTRALAVFQQYDPRVRYVYQPRAGRSIARNRGFGLALGAFICFLDSDDRLLGTALESHARAFRSEGGLGMVVGGYQRIDQTGTVVGERRPWTECATLTPEAWLFNCLAMPGSVAVRREWLERAGGFDSACETGEDWDLFLRLAFAGCPMAWTRDLVCQRRQHPGNSTNDVRTHRQGSLRALEKVFRQPGLSKAVAALENRARAWAYAASARNAAALGLDALVDENLHAAAELDALPGWERRGLSVAPLGFPSLVEGPLADTIEREGEHGVRELLAELPTRWNIPATDIRRAAARVALRRFFDALARDARDEAAGHLRHGLGHDRRWVAHRAVAAFLLRRAFQR